MTVSRDPTVLLPEVRRAAAREGVAFEGDGASGSFEGKISGRYRVNGNRVRITLTDWPWYASGAMVESRFRGFFER